MNRACPFESVNFSFLTWPLCQSPQLGERVDHSPDYVRRCVYGCTQFDDNSYYLSSQEFQ